ncbi:MAG: hypothetical protein V7K50_29055 [Nostoc sp.]|uniref:hypothetical protein n=1 Tax=Nostoc sp. TaxID=1180 RepID=UPI002FF65363
MNFRCDRRCNQECEPLKRDASALKAAASSGLAIALPNPYLNKYIRFMYVIIR